MTQPGERKKKVESPDRIPFAFGERIAKRIETPREAAVALAEATPYLTGYQALDPAGEFFAKSALIRLGDLDLLSYAASRVSIELGDCNTIEFVVMLAGSVKLDGRDGKSSSHNPKVAALQGVKARRIETTPCSGVLARISPERLLATLNAISGDDPHNFDLCRLLESQIFVLQFGDYDFGQIFRTFFRTLDAHAAHAAFYDYRIPEILGLDDQFYRLAALSISPQLLLDGQAPAAPVARDRIDMLCDVIRSMRDRFLTLTEMETMTGLSRRTLQHNFLKRFQCSPMAWQRRERLFMAREMLARSEADGVNIAALGYELGFASPSSFADFYRRMFGETPGVTLRRRKAPDI